MGFDRFIYSVMQFKKWHVRKDSILSTVLNFISSFLNNISQRVQSVKF